MSVLPVQHCTNPANVSVSLESDLAGLPTQTYPDGTTIWARSSQVLFCWDSLSSAGTVAGTSVAVATGGAWIAIGSVSSSLGPFNTVSAVTLGSRLLDVSASQISALKAGTLVWVLSVKDYWRWDPLSTLTADNITVCNPTANGANPGRFIRALIPAPEWIQQATWVIDEGNSSGTANNENDGLTAATSLLTDTERQRRMGRLPLTLAAYHFRYISDAVFVSFPNNLNGAQVFFHGSMTDGQGQSTIYTGSITALTAQVPATNTAYLITDAAIPVSWTASGLVQTSGNPPTNRRIRITSNTVGVKLWAVFDIGGGLKQVRCTDTMQVTAYTSPYTAGFGSTALVNGSTFVVEKLSAIRFLSIGAQDNQTVQGATKTPGTVIFESLMLGTGTGGSGITDINTGAVIDIDGCIVNLPANSNNFFGKSNVIMSGCFITGTAISGSNLVPANGNYSFVAGGTDVILSWQGTELNSINHFRNNFMFQNGLLSINKGVVQIASMAIFDPPVAIQVGMQILGHGMVILANNAPIWGGGTVRPPTSCFFLNNPARVAYTTVTGFTLVGSSVDIQFDSRPTTIPAFDQATGLFTAPRTTSFANLIATVAAGGFGGTILDPASGSFFGTQ